MIPIRIQAPFLLLVELARRSGKNQCSVIQYLYRAAQRLPAPEALTIDL